MFPWTHSAARHFLRLADERGRVAPCEDVQTSGLSPGDSGRARRWEVEMPFVCLESNQQLLVSFSFSTSFLRSFKGFVAVVVSSSLIFSIGQGERKYGNMKQK